MGNVNLENNGKEETAGRGKRAGAVRDTFMLRALHGRILSIDFFRRNWLVVLAAVIMLMAAGTPTRHCEPDSE